MSQNKFHSRISISGLFFLHGLIFSTWAVRIPSIQEAHHLGETELGNVLLSMPIGSFLSMPVAAALVPRFGSRRVLLAGIMMYAFVLVTLGLAPSVFYLLFAGLFFGFSSNLVNVSLNTQAVSLEDRYGRSIMASLHGLWSLAGLAGAGIGGLLIKLGLLTWQHFLLTTGFAVCGALATAEFLLEDRNDAREKKKFFQIPDRTLLGLGLIAFCSLICEGTMFDWSGIYFKKVVGAEGAAITAGYTAFMFTMAGTRFIADALREKLGTKKVLMLSGTLVFTGLMLSILFPTFEVALIGFLLVGSGVSSVIPLVYSVTGKTTSMEPSTAIAAVSTMGYFGFLIGPPLIGWIAGATSLRVSFFVIALMGMGIALLSQGIKKT